MIIVGLEESGYPTWSGIATLMPVFTLVAYLFIGESKGGVAVSSHARFVLIGTLVSWVPYMIAIIILAPKVGAYKSIAVGILIFFVCAAAFLLISNKYNLFM